MINYYNITYRIAKLRECLHLVCDATATCGIVNNEEACFCRRGYQLIDGVHCQGHSLDPYTHAEATLPLCNYILYLVYTPANIVPLTISHIYVFNILYIIYI